MRFGANNMYDELLSLELKKSPMWEINNPRVSKLLGGILELVLESKKLVHDQKEEIFNILISLVKIYGDPKLIKRDNNDC
tara:strand:+ start:474 stop:713 length:240 start_codon:yes stop_codon:yes gene_type:complete